MRRWNFAFALIVVLFGTGCAARTAATLESAPPKSTFQVGCTEPWGFDKSCVEVSGYGAEKIERLLEVARLYGAAYTSWYPQKGNQAWKVRATFGSEDRNLADFLYSIGLLGYAEINLPTGGARARSTKRMVEKIDDDPPQGP